MKTTIDISTPLLERAKTLAVEEGTTLKNLVEEGLRMAIERREEEGGFRLRRVSFRGDGVQPGIDVARWDRVRDAVYEGRGG